MAAEGEALSCLMHQGTLNSEVVNTKNPRYTRDAQDGWGHFYLPSHCTTSAISNLHNPERFATGYYIPDAWSLQRLDGQVVGIQNLVMKKTVMSS